MISRLYLILVVVCSTLGVAKLRAANIIYLDPTQPLDARVHDLVSRMTLEEKGAELKNNTPGVPRLGIPKYNWWNEALHGVAREGDATVFPQAIALAATWDDALLKEVGAVIGIEGRAKYNARGALGEGDGRHYGLTFWSPNINIFRDPRWGRGQETYGEDPWLTSRIGVAFVQGLQGTDERYLQAAACAKHFAVHSGPESLRHRFDATPPEADLYETYLPAFEALVREGHVEGVMTAYNALYGKPCAVNPLLYSLLNSWGFHGYITSDCGAIGDLSRTYKLAKDDAEAEALSLQAGLCIRCGATPSALSDAVKRGLITEEVIDRQLGHLLRTLFHLGIFDPPQDVPFSTIPLSENNSPAHQQLAQRTAAEAIVLLKNDGTLPLNLGKIHRVAVIGPNASSETALVGNYNGTPVSPVTILAGLKFALGSQVQLEYARGCDYASRPGGVQTVPRTALYYSDDAGLSAEYFAGTNLSGEPVVRRRDRGIDFDTTRARLPNGVPATDFSARWSGQLLTTFPGNYRLIVSGTGGFRLRVNNQTVIDAWSGQGTSREATCLLPGDSSVPLVLEYFQYGTRAKILLQWQPPGATAGYEAAMEIARRADAVIFVGGITAQMEGEEMNVDYEGFFGGDRTAIELPAVQEDLLGALEKLHKPLIFVNMSGSAVAMPGAAGNANAILQVWYPGQAGGTAVADVVTGKVNPAGRLPVTFYRATSDLPNFDDYSMAGRTYRYYKGQPLYAFGHGLSFTTFAYNTPHISGAAENLRVTIEIANTGNRDGDEVVQLYTIPPHARENEALCAFSRVHLARGERRTVTLNVSPTALRRWDSVSKGYSIPRGDWKFLIGASSADIRQTVTLPL